MLRAHTAARIKYCLPFAKEILCTMIIWIVKKSTFYGYQEKREKLKKFWIMRDTLYNKWGIYCFRLGSFYFNIFFFHEKMHKYAHNINGILKFFQLSCTIKQGLANLIYDIKILLLLNLKLAFDFPRKHIDNKL